jgi:hypothetical protein
MGEEVLGVRLLDQRVHWVRPQGASTLRRGLGVKEPLGWQSQSRASFVVGGGGGFSGGAAPGQHTCCCQGQGDLDEDDGRPRMVMSSKRPQVGTLRGKGLRAKEPHWVKPEGGSSRWGYEPLTC